MTPAMIELTKTAARTLLAHHAVGRHCDPESLRWAREFLANNPGPTPTAPYDDELPAEWINA